MLNFEDAFEIVIGSANRLGSEQVDIGRALGRILAQDVVSDIDMPPFNKSAMDGFACRREDSGDILTVIETIAAGYVPQKTIGHRQCARIMTGAIVPEGADCVIMVEYTRTIAENQIRFTGQKTADNICYKAEDAKAGDFMIRKGTRLRAEHIAVLASAGCTNPLVSHRPRVGIIATGDELVEPATKPGNSQIRNSNSYQLAAQAASMGALPCYYGIAADTEQTIDTMLKKAMAETDVVLISGGVSAGDFDFVPKILRENNIRLVFEKVAIKPGKPTVFGIAEDGFVFGLPGNPVSGFVLF